MTPGSHRNKLEADTEHETTNGLSTSREGVMETVEPLRFRRWMNRLSNHYSHINVS